MVGPDSVHCGPAVSGRPSRCGIAGIHSSGFVPEADIFEALFQVRVGRRGGYSPQLQPDFRVRAWLSHSATLGAGISSAPRRAFRPAPLGLGALEIASEGEPS
jgi:hypothetical protein